MTGKEHVWPVGPEEEQKIWARIRELNQRVVSLTNIVREMAKSSDKFDDFAKEFEQIDASCARYYAWRHADSTLELEK